MILVATGVMTGTTKKIKSFFSKQRSRYHSLLWKNYGKPKKLIKQVCENRILSPGVNYVWGRY